MVHASITSMTCKSVSEPDHFELAINFRDGKKMKRTLETSELRELIGVIDNAIGSEIKVNTNGKKKISR